MPTKTATQRMTCDPSGVTPNLSPIREGYARPTKAAAAAHGTKVQAGRSTRCTCRRFTAKVKAAPGKGGGGGGGGDNQNSETVCQ